MKQEGLRFWRSAGAVFVDWEGSAGVLQVHSAFTKPADARSNQMEAAWLAAALTQFPRRFRRHQNLHED